MKAIFFDLDNTLHDNGQYFLGAFIEISDYLSKKNGISERKIFKNLKKIWKKNTSVYPYLFNDLFKTLGIKNKSSVKNIVKMFNEYKGILKPYKDAILTLKELKKRNYKLGIITNGNPKQQERKIGLLNIKYFFNAIIYADQIKPKPSKKPFLAALKKLKVTPDDALYVGDNPLTDFEGAKKTGIKTVRILRGEFRKKPKNKYIDFQINNLSELLRNRKLNL